MRAVEKARDSVAAVYDEEKKKIDGRWERQKADIVPGDLLLDRVCQGYGVRFKKGRDSIRLAELFRENEIPQDIKEVLNDFVS